MRALLLCGIVLLLMYNPASFVHAAEVKQSTFLSDLSASLNSDPSQLQRTNTINEKQLAIVQEAISSDVKDQVLHAQWERQFIRCSWTWHLFSTAFLFVMVLSVVVFGLFITYQQFTREYKELPRIRRKTKSNGASSSLADASTSSAAQNTVAPPIPIAATPIPSNHLKIGLEGLEVSSQVIGLMVLAMSLAFFYFYIVKVYPMQTEELTQVQPKPKLESERGSASATPATKPAEK